MTTRKVSAPNTPEKKAPTLQTPSFTSTPPASPRAASNSSSRAPSAESCRKCEKKPRMWSKRTKSYIQLCQDCNTAKCETNRSSYHKRHRAVEKEGVYHEQLASRGVKLYDARRSCAELRERLAVLQKRNDGLQIAYEESQKALASALANSNLGGSGAVEPLPGAPSAISVRNESIVVQRLQELTEMVTDWRANSKAEVTAIVEALRTERQEQKEHMATVIAEMEMVISKMSRLLKSQ